MKIALIILSAALMFAPGAVIFAQDQQAAGTEQQEPETNQPQENADAGEVLMLEEIRIEVAPELPTVVVTIQRQKPDIERITIQNPLNRMLRTEIEMIKPDLCQMKVSELKDSKKMLARDRKR